MSLTGTTITLVGHKELVHKLDRLGNEGLKIAKKATSKAMVPVAKDAKNRARNLSGSAPWANAGLLAKSIGKKTVGYKPSQIALTMVGVRTATQGTRPGFSNFQTISGRVVRRPVPQPNIQKPHKYLHFVLLGTKSHPQPNSIFGPNYIHPGARKRINPFLNDAIKSQQGKLLRVFENSVEEQIFKTVRT